jgi:hypothetical protein
MCRGHAQVKQVLVVKGLGSIFFDFEEKTLKRPTTLVEVACGETCIWECWELFDLLG